MKHHIILKLKKTDNPEEIIEGIKNLYNETLKIDGVKKVDIYTTNSKLRNRFDLMIKMDLSKEALKEYENSKIHNEIKEKYDSAISKKTVFDCN